MHKQQSIWQALERVPGLAAVATQWKALLGSQMSDFQGFFRPNGKLASSYPCLRPKGCGCAHKIVIHAPDDIVAVCTCGRGCETMKLTKPDIVIYELNFSMLGSTIVSALHAVHDEVLVGGLHMTRRIGIYSPYAGFRFPIYLSIQIEVDDFLHVVEHLIAENDKSFILLAPTRDLCMAACEDLLCKRQSCFLALSDILAISGEKTFETVRPVEEILAEFRSSTVPEPKDSSSMVFLEKLTGEELGEAIGNKRIGGALKEKAMELLAEKKAVKKEKEPKRVEKHKVVLKTDSVEIDNVRVLTGRADKTRKVFGLLCQQFVKDAATRKPLGEYKAVTGRELAELSDWDEMSVRQAIARLRKRIRTRIKKEQGIEVGNSDIIENLRKWKGYRINPKRVVISSE